MLIFQKKVQCAIYSTCLRKIMSKIKILEFIPLFLGLFCLSSLAYSVAEETFYSTQNHKQNVPLPEFSSEVFKESKS